MTGSESLLLIGLFALVVVAAVLGAAEAALLRVSRVRLEVAAESGDSRSRSLVGLLDDLPRVLNTVLLVVLLVQIGAATLAGVLAQHVFGSLGVTLTSIVLTFVLFVYSEAIPKTYAVRHPERVARSTAPLLQFLSWLFRPIVTLLVGFADLQAPGTGIASPSAPTEAELLRLASEAAATGTIDESDRILMDRAFELGDQRVDDIYVPRLDIVAVPESTPINEALDEAIARGHRRLPIYDTSIDNITGVVLLSELAREVAGKRTIPLSSIAEEPLVVPESRRVIDLLSDMQAHGTHFAIVVDEYGGTAGIVTIEDVVARLVGPIGRDHAPIVHGIERTDTAGWLVSGSVDLDDLERETGIDLPEGDWNTVAGFIIGHIGRLPAPGEAITSDGLQFEVLAISHHRIVDVRVSRIAS
ncbi:MAG: hemolysin family protein [Actinomycetota bacterium]